MSLTYKYRSREITQTICCILFSEAIFFIIYSCKMYAIQNNITFSTSFIKDRKHNYALSSLCVVISITWHKFSIFEPQNFSKITA